MAEIEITLPTIQYGNVKVRATPEELGVDISEPGSVGMVAAMYLNLFTQGFKRGSEVNVTLDPETAVSAPQGASQDYTLTGPLGDAEKLLNEGLGGVTEVDGQDPEGPGEEPGESWTEADHAPWDQKVEAKPKPWEKSGKPASPAVEATAKVASIDW